MLKLIELGKCHWTLSVWFWTCLDRFYYKLPNCFWKLHLHFAGRWQSKSVVSSNKFCTLQNAKVEAYWKCCLVCRVSSSYCALSKLCNGDRIAFFIIVPFTNVLVLLVMLSFEVKRLGCHLNTFCDKKILIFIILTFM